MSIASRRRSVTEKEADKENIPRPPTDLRGAIVFRKTDDLPLKEIFDSNNFHESLKDALCRHNEDLIKNKCEDAPYQLPVEFSTSTDAICNSGEDHLSKGDSGCVSGSDVVSPSICDGLRHSKRLRASSTFSSTSSFASKRKKIVPRVSSTDDEWLKRTPIYVADGRRKKTPKFPDRKRSTFCYLCGEKDDNLVKCSAHGCSTSFHDFCARMRADGEYTFEFMQRNRGVYCPRHHCTSCFSDHNRVRCFNGNQCELAWHPDCIPGGCALSNKSEIICPRHVAYPNPMHLHTGHCADCQKKHKTSNGEKIIRCDTCLRSLHEKCYHEVLHASDRTMLLGDEEISTSELIGRCNWCRSFDFVRYGQFCMGRFGSTKWYPCQVVSNDLYPRQDDPNLGRVGYLVVKWLPYQNKTFFNLLTHNRVLPMTEMDYFFVTEADDSGIHKEWALAQKHALLNNPENSVPKPDQIDLRFSNGERVRQITRCKYSSNDLRPSRNQLHTADMCLCPANLPDRCGPTSNCINRALHIECPKLCESKGSCMNRALINGNNCAKVSIVPCHGRYFGAITLENIPANGFVGEYVGEIITHEEKQRRIDRIARMKSIEAQYYIMDLDGHRAIDAMYYGNDMRYVNHSCQPNCSVQVITSELDIHLVLVALRDIKKGEELSFDYNMYSTSAGRDVPKCRCNAENCSGILSAAGTNGSGANGKDVLTKRRSIANVQNLTGKAKTKLSKSAALKITARSSTGSSR